MKKKVFVITNIYPHYRKSIYEKLLNADEFNVTFFLSKTSIDNIKTIEFDKIYDEEKKIKLKEVKNIFFTKRLIWQLKVIRLVFNRVDAVIFLSEVTCLTTWITSIIFKTLGVKIIFWGHGIYGKENSLLRSIRILFYKIPHYNLVYEKRSKKLLVEFGIKEQKIKVIYNSINYFQQLEIFKRLEKNKPKNIFQNNYPTLLFIGRLTAQKRVHELIEVVKKLNKKDDVNLLIIGDGDLKEELKKKAKDLINNGKCIFYGKAYNEEDIAPLIYNSDLTVSPGNIGLTAIHSLSYGTPICSHSNLNKQMPEVEVIEEGMNGFLFKESDLDSQEKEISKWLKGEKRNKLKIREKVDLLYNPNYQFRVINEIISK